MTPTLIIGAELSVLRASRDVEDVLTTANTFENPDFARKERLGLWTGDTDRYIRLFRRTAGGLIVPRGTFPIAVRALRDRGIKFDIIDHTVAPLLDVPVTTTGTLFPYQQQALDALLKWQTGLLESPTGSGKTNILLSIIARLNMRTLILTHTAELFRQMCERCHQWNGVDPGMLGGGKWNVQPISVAMIQTLAKRDLQEIAPYFGCVLVDECHHAPARTWADILNQLPARYKYGATATAWRKDRLQVLMWRTIGTVTAKVSQADVETAGTVIAPHIEVVPTSFKFNLVESTDWGRMLAALIRDGQRNHLVVEQVRARMGPTTKALILSDRVEHVYQLAEMLEDLSPVVLTGEMAKAERDTGMATVRAGASLTIATSALLGEGIDVPGWDLLFMATPMAGGPRTLQAVGRVSRAAPGKDRATVVDFVDVAVPALVNAHAQRDRLYRGVQQCA